ncbi:MAG: DUF2796 domain-containing protein [Pikeienuella sp.]
MTRDLFAPIAAAVLALSGAAGAAETRELGAHVHGSGSLDIAVEGNTVAMALVVPGFDIVGFEHEATSDADKAAIEDGKAKLGKPLELFVLPAAAGCEVAQVQVALISEVDAHGHDEHGEDAHGHDDHGHDAHGEESHTEFKTEYQLTCADPSAISEITFAYFETFPNAEELEIQLITAKGSTGLEATRDAPVVSLADLI